WRGEFGDEAFEQVYAGMEAPEGAEGDDMAIKGGAPKTGAAGTSAGRLAEARARMRAFLQDSEVAEQARAAMEREEPTSDEVIRRAQAGELAEEAFTEGYGEQFVRDLKSRYGG